MAVPLTFQQFRQWVKHDTHPLAKQLFSIAKLLRSWDFPAPKFIYSPTYFLFKFTKNTLDSIARLTFWTPMFKTRISRIGKGLYLYGGMPYTSGPLRIEIGDFCRISGRTTLSGRSNTLAQPTLVLGNNIDLGWMTTIAVGNRVELQDNVRIAGQCFLAGYPGHPMNADDRAKGLPETEEQIGDIILEKDVWLGTGVSVMAGVTIGEGTVVGAASVVTRDLPAHVLAAGNPARVIRHLKPSSNSTTHMEGQ